MRFSTCLITSMTGPVSRSLAICLGAVFLATSLRGGYAASADPLHSPLANVQVTLHNLSSTDWTQASVRNKELLARFDSAITDSYNWSINPQTCMPTRDFSTISGIKDIINSGVSQVFSEKEHNKKILFALNPNNSTLEHFVPDIKTRLSHCATIEGHTHELFPSNQSYVHATVSPYRLPYIAGATQVYADQVTVSLTPPTDGVMWVSQIDGTRFSINSLEDLTGVLYIALLRNTWIFGLETSPHEGVAELLPLFTKQAQLINAAS